MLLSMLEAFPSHYIRYLVPQFQDLHNLVLRKNYILLSIDRKRISL